MAPKVSKSVTETIPKQEAPLVKEKKVKAAVKETAPLVVVAAPVVAAPVVAATAAPVVDEPVATESDIIVEQSSLFFSKLQQLTTAITSLKSEYRSLEKKWLRELKLAQKLSSKRKRKAGNRAPSGFVKPTRISDELASFLEKPSGSEMARTEVTRDINKYIRTHNLQDKVNGRKIIPDDKLASLLKLEKTDELTYFNLQRYMSPHFAKAIKEVAAVVA